jgi:hypothetical protein
LNESNQQKFRKKIVIVVIALLVALIHFVKSGSYWGGPFALFWNGYMFDVIVPLGFYFLLCANEFSFLKYWFSKAAFVFIVAAGVEIAQYFGAHILGSTFDPVDFIMFGIGVIMAIIFDVILFPRIFKFWRVKT